MKKLYLFLCAAQIAALYAIYYYTNLALRDSYFGALTMSKGIAFGFMLLIGLIAISKPVRRKLGISENKRDISQVVTLAIVAPSLSLLVGNCIAMTFGGLGGDF